MSYVSYGYVLNIRLRQPGIDLLDQFCGGPGSDIERSCFVSKKKSCFHFRVGVCVCPSRFGLGIPESVGFP